jgi:hypothetical protein
MTNVEPEEIKTRIFKIRGQQVMLDTDLAKLYGVPVFRLNEAVRRNARRFPDDFLFKLTRFEWTNLISQIAISSSLRGGRRHSPYAFTEQGVAMLSSVLRSERAIEVNIAIMRAFVKLRHALANNRYLAHKVEKMEGRLGLVETDIRLILDEVGRLKRRFSPDAPIPPRVI